MDQIRKKSIIVGALLLLSLVVGILSIDPVIDELNNLEKISLHTKPILVRSFMQFLLALIYASIPIVLYSLFIKINTSLTIGFLVFRTISVVFILNRLVEHTGVTDIKSGICKSRKPRIIVFSYFR